MGPLRQGPGQQGKYEAAMIAEVGTMGMGVSPYKLSFTAGGLLLTGSVIVAEEYARHLEWKATVESVRDKNLLQARTASAGNRVLREIRGRLQSLTDQQLALVPTGCRWQCLRAAREINQARGCRHDSTDGS